MRKIKITDRLRIIVEKFNEDLFENTRQENFCMPMQRLQKLHDDLKPGRHKEFRKYIKKIIDNYQMILNADPEKMEVLKSEFNAIVDTSQMSRKIPTKKFAFHEEVVFAMRYEELRDKEYPYYLLNSDLRTCVYCNSQSAVTIEPVYYDKKKRKKRKRVLSKLQLDHFYPKSKYPFLCTSFFNLYPTCANCNLAKGKENALFELYTSGEDLDVFQFKLDDKSVIDYWMSLDLNKLIITLETVDGDKTLLENHNDLFQLQKIYDAQKDVGEELVWKAKANPQVYKKYLQTNFNKLFPDASIIDRMIIGNYSKPEETFKRPMSKYTQDIARQLKIIK